MNLRPTNTIIVPKAQDDSNKSLGHFRGRGQK